MENPIPTQLENPNGLHQKYFVKEFFYMGKTPIETPDDPQADYFVLRLDAGQKDQEHFEACTKAIHVYAKHMAPFKPQLAKELDERYNKDKEEIAQERLAIREVKSEKFCSKWLNNLSPELYEQAKMELKIMLQHYKEHSDKLI